MNLLLAMHPMIARMDPDQLVFIVPIAIVGIVYYYAHCRNKLAHDTLRKMVDSGQQVTPEVIAALKVKPGCGSGIGSIPAWPNSNSGTGGSDRSRRDFRSAIILLAIGAGVIMMMGRVGWIMFFLGLAFLILSVIDKAGQVPPGPVGDIINKAFSPFNPSPQAPPVPAPAPQPFTPQPAPQVFTAQAPPPPQPAQPFPPSDQPS